PTLHPRSVHSRRQGTNSKRNQNRKRKIDKKLRIMKYIIVSLLILPYLSINSQQNVQTGFYEDITKNLNLATPNAAAFEEFSFNKVNHFNGSIAKSISLFDIKVGRLNYPINLSYYMGGIKVNTIASDVGLGWSLNNASI